MKRLAAVLFCAAVAGGVFAEAQVTPPKTHLKVGDMAPDFELKGTNNATVKLSDFRGKKSVVVAFFPAAFTGG